MVIRSCMKGSWRSLYLIIFMIMSQPKMFFACPNHWHHWFTWPMAFLIYSTMAFLICPTNRILDLPQPIAFWSTNATIDLLQLVTCLICFKQWQTLTINIYNMFSQKYFDSFQSMTFLIYFGSWHARFISINDILDMLDLLWSMAFLIYFNWWDSWLTPNDDILDLFQSTIFWILN